VLESTSTESECRAWEQTIHVEPLAFVPAFVLVQKVLEIEFWVVRLADFINLVDVVSDVSL
jgi:hypothetical protein